MKNETVYIDLDHAHVAHTREGIELTSESDTVVLNGAAASFEQLLKAAALATCALPFHGTDQ